MKQAPSHLEGNPALAAVWSAMNRIAPLSLADSSWDNTGVLLQAPDEGANKGDKAFLAIDLTTDVVDEVLERGDVLILVVYHPIIFRGLKSITMADPQQRSLLRLLNANISIYTPHTSLDACRDGINDWLARAVAGQDTALKGQGLTSQSTSHDGGHEAISTSKDPANGHDGAGMGRIAELEAPATIQQLIERMKKATQLQHIQLAKPASIPLDAPIIRSVAVCAGSGSSVLRGAKADAYVTGELSHHEVLAAVAQGTVVITTNHSNSERAYLRDRLQAKLTAELDHAKSDDSRLKGVVVSDRDADPLLVV